MLKMPLPVNVPIVKNHTINLKLKNALKNTSGGVSFFVKLPVKDSNFTENDTPPQGYF